MREPNKLTKLKRDWFHKERLLMKEMKSQCRIRKNTKFCSEWNRSMLKLLSFILRLKIRSRLNWLKKKSRSWYVCLPKWAQLWMLRLKKRKMNLEESIPKKFKKELTLLRKGNFRLTFSYCEDIYNAGRFNFTVMEWAIKEIIKEERE